MNRLKRSFILRQPVKGFTLIELGVVIAIVAILAAFAAVSFSGKGEREAAVMVQSVQNTLQSIVTQGSARMDVNPANLNHQAILVAASATLNQQNGSNISLAISGSNFVLRILKPQFRTATYEINNMGMVSLNDLTNFQNYQKDSNDPASIEKK